MEKWMQSTDNRKLCDWLLMEHRGILSANNSGSYIRKLPEFEKKQIVVLAQAGIVPFSLLCWPADANLLKNSLNTRGNEQLALLGDVSGYQLLSEYVLNGARIRTGTIDRFDKLPGEKQDNVWNALLNIVWVILMDEEDISYFKKTNICE